MENIEIAKSIATIAAPLTKAVIDQWLVPKIVSLKAQWSRKNEIEDHFFDNKFSDYLIERYKSYSVLNILAFRNQQRLLKDIYLPLTVSMEADPKHETEYYIEEYNKDFISSYGNILIVDTAGMGKSTISKKLFLSSMENNSGIPVFIELRRLTKNRSLLEEIHKELNLINEHINKELVLDLIRKGDFIFFLDGYDEVSSEDKTAVTEDIQRFVNNASENIFILTSRPDDSLVSFGNFQAFSINPLKEDEVYELLSKYDENGELSKSLISKLKDHYYHNLSEFLTNPLLVSLLFTAYEYKHTVPLKKHIFYRQVYDALYEAHDLSKGDYYHRDKFSKLAIDDFHTVLRYVSFFCLKRDKIEFNKDEILTIIEAAKEKCEIIDFKKSDFLKDLITTVPLFVKEGLYYKWAHKSLYEYFVAQFIYQDTGDNRSQLLNSLAKTQYINIIDIYSNIDYKSFRKDVVLKVISNFFEFCSKDLNITGVNSKSIIERKEMTFCQNFLVIQFGEVENASIAGHENHELSTKCFQIVEKSFPSRKDDNDEPSGYGIRISNSVSNDISAVNYTIVLEKANFQRSLDEFIISHAYSKNEPFVKKIKWNKRLEIKNFNIQKETPFIVNEDPKSPLNQAETFDFVNELISAYHEDDYIFDYSKCKKFSEEQDQGKQMEKEKDFLTLEKKYPHNRL